VARQADVHVVGVSALAAGHLTLVPALISDAAGELLNTLRERREPRHDMCGAVT
jgi:methylmalonyl-CoA mutase cobalamin-binding domain/chain